MEFAADDALKLCALSRKKTVLHTRSEADGRGPTCSGKAVKR